MREIYFDMTTGISGDMAIAALLSLGLDNKLLSDKLSSLLKCNVELSLKDEYRNSILAKQLVIKTDDNSKEFRHFKDIKTIIQKSDFNDNVKTRSINTFTIIAKAEGYLHGVDIEEVHFHEIGAVDTLIDVVGFNFGLDHLGIDKVSASFPLLGSGTIKTEHGVLPLPAPATLKILEGLAVRKVSDEGEFTTPTGAAILKSSVDEYRSSFTGKVLKETYSTGTHIFENMPNLLRAVLLESDGKSVDTVFMIESNIDDMTGESFGYLANKLIDACALDVTYTPIFTKKNRPAYKISVMCDRGNKDKIIDTVLRYSTTIGVRVSEIDRVIMAREIISMKLEGERIDVKKSTYNDIIKYAPEWDDCVRLADRLKFTPMDIYNKVMALTKDL